MKAGSQDKGLALSEAETDCANLIKYLWQHRSGVSWVLGIDYIYAWEMYRRAEEALLIIMPRPELIGEMRRDQLAVKNASISNREDLLDNLQQALAILDPAAIIYFREHQPGYQAVEELKQAVDHHKEALKKLFEAFNQINAPVDVEINVASNSSTRTRDLDVDKEATARRLALQVRRALNEYRSNLWGNLLHARNHLLLTIALTGITTYVLLLISILANPLLPNLLAAVAFYIVGALTGLGGRFYKELESNSTMVGDFHLSLVRLVTVPLLSGLAGIGGVLITTMLTTWSVPNAGQNLVTLETIFRLEPGSLFIAAMFGFTPNLLFQSLQRKAEKYSFDLERSQAESSKIHDKNAG